MKNLDLISWRQLKHGLLWEPISSWHMQRMEFLDILGNSPPIATYMISQYTKEKDLVIDPMCGSGTTALEAGILKRRCAVNDVNPLSVLISKVKTTKIDKSLLEEKLEYLKANYRPMSLEEYAFVPVALKDPDHWFLKETSDSLRGIKYLIEQETDTNLKIF